MKTKKKAMPEVEKPEKTELPKWFTKDLVGHFKAGVAHTFVLHGDVNGLVRNPDSEESADQPYITVKEFLDRVFSNRKMVIFYDIASGVQFLDPKMEQDFRQIVGLSGDDDRSGDPVAAAKANLVAKRGIPRDPDSCLPMIEKVLKARPDVAVVVQSVHFIAPNATGGALPQNERANIERLRNWSNDAEMRGSGAIVLMFTDQAAKVNGELRSTDNAIPTIFIPKPDKAERKNFTDRMTGRSNALVKLAAQIKKLQGDLKKVSSNASRAMIQSEIARLNEEIGNYPSRFTIPDDFDPDVFAHATQGMSLRQILELFQHAQQSSKAPSLDYVKDKKREILNAEYGEVMEIVDPKRGLDDIGGLDYVKVYMKNLLDAIRTGESRLVSMGVTLMGPPGTGKTAIVEALATEARFNFVKTKNIRSMWVGESEVRMQKMIYGLRSLAPVVVMNDEADLAEASRDAPKGDSGVSERLMKMWMELLSDPAIRGQIIVISCTNRPDRIDAALKRSGRSDERILIPMPSQREMPAIFQVMFKRYGIPTNVTDFAEYSKLTDGLSGADIEKISLNAYKFAFEQKKKLVTGEVLRESIKDFIPSASQADIDRMTLMGILECSSRRLLPPNIKEIIARIRSRNLVENLPAFLAQIKARDIAEID